MPYVENRVVHDADSHLMELPDALDEFIEQRFRSRYDALPKLQKHPRDADYVAQARAKQVDPLFRSTADENILLRKNYEALGSFKRADRPRALDQLGFASQLIFTTWCLGNFDLDQSGDVGLCYAVAHAHNRMMSAFCSVDRRFLGTAYVPLASFDDALATAREAIKLGCKALLIPSRCPAGISPSHVGFEPLWSLAQEAQLPIVFHVGGEEKLQPDYFNNGLPRVKDFHGGEENFTSLSFMPIPHSVQITLAASWVPSWMRFMDSAASAFIKNEPRLQKLSLKPSEFVRRQVRVTPYPHEDAGWIIANSGEEVCLFSSDYPHVEGGRNPLKRFNDSLTQTNALAVDRFFCDNFVDLMGEGLPHELRKPRGLSAA
jgi:predicted TIM-barrel fold metal-dependent hydrolase